MWAERDRAGSWTHSALQRLYVYLGLAGVFILPEVLALVLFIIPWVRNALETSDWRIFTLITWWFEVRVQLDKTFSLYWMHRCIWRFWWGKNMWEEELVAGVAKTFSFGCRVVFLLDAVCERGYLIMLSEYWWTVLTWSPLETEAVYMSGPLDYFDVDFCANSYVYVWWLFRKVNIYI